MTQTRLSSLQEALVSVAIGYLVSVLVTAWVMPMYGHAVSVGENLQITAIFTIASIARGYAVRRWFNARARRAAGGKPH